MANYRAALGENAAIWSLSADDANNDIVRSPEDQSDYRTALRRLLDRIKARHGQNAVLNIFPALPASLAVETGRVWMPKSDLAMTIYDQSRSAGFVPTFTLGD